MKIGVLQLKLTDFEEENIQKIFSFSEEIKSNKLDLLLLPELFQGHYFCKTKDKTNFSRAKTIEESLSIKKMQELSKSLNLAIPVSFFEKSGDCFYNSVAFVDEYGENCGVYRKTHIPDGPGYEEKFYFKPGNTGFKCFETKGFKVGVGICWDQWFPEAARSMAMLGADILLYPTAIGSEPTEPDMDTSGPWQKVMQGHAVANSVFVAAANRVGVEDSQLFYGRSFISDYQGEIVCEAGSSEDKLLTYKLCMDDVQKYREFFGLMRDRKPEMYIKG